MRLSRIELKGFKSFANETHIHIGEDVVGIVGPNGSGKSNIVDAIRWALGELGSKELRLASMSDVIFNGTKTRRAASSARVTLIFDNTKNILPTEYQSVAITRILYKNGQSEYRINDVKCRLKDINALLADSGVGSNSYAIIALGMVEDILSDKNDARRQMFEQAAGISKYKSRKKQTLQKLASTQEDIERLNDLLFEVEGNLQDLKKQASRTKKYQKLKEDYRDSFFSLARWRWTNFDKSYSTVQKEKIKQSDQLSELQSLIVIKESELESLKTQILSDEKNLSSQQKLVNSKQETTRDLHQQIELKKKQIEFIEESIKNSETQIHDQSVKFASLGEEENSLVHKQTGAKEKWKNLESQFSGLKEKKDKVDQDWSLVKQDVQESNLELSSLEKEIGAIQQELAVNQSKIDNSQNLLFSLEEELRLHESEFADVHKKNVQTLQNLSLLEKDYDRVSKDLDEQVLNQKNLKEKIESTTSELNKKQLEIDSSGKEIQLLQNLIDQMEGFPESVKFLSKAENHKVDLQLLSDIISVEDDVRRPVENFLGQYLNYFVVSTTRDALQAIELLHNSQKGKAGFFILDQVPSSKKSSSDNTLLEKIEVKPKYQDLVNELFGEVKLYDFSQNGQSATTEKWVSPDGHIVKNKFVIDGGSVGLFEGGKLGRKSRIENLEKNLKRFDKEKENLKNQINKLQKQYESIDTEILEKEKQELKKKIDQEIQTKVTWEVMISSSDNVKSTILTKKQDASELKETLSEKIKNLESTQKEKLQILNKLKSKIEEDRSKEESVSKEKSDLHDQYNQTNIALITAKNLVENITSQIDYLYKNRVQLKNSNTEIEEKIKNWNQEKIALLSSIEKSQEDINKTELELQEFSKNLNLSEKNYFSKKGQINTLETEYRNIEKSRTQISELIATIDRKISELEVEKNRIKDRLEVEFEIDISDLLSEPISEALSPSQETQLEQEVVSKKERIVSFGPINPLALEAYEEMNNRFDNIINQRDDVLSAKESLMNTITEIEETATRLYVDSFTKIKGNFQRVFRSLFSAEDDCDLVMLDPENPLESKIEIIAKPKGKKPKSISQLSGGEKTLTSIALLFSLYLIKPAPFCIFDEIDAPLDDVNVEKFNNIIREFSQESQFIIITHNKLTMADVDVIYGVFMEEPGISGVTSVDFSEL